MNLRDALTGDILDTFGLKNAPPEEQEKFLNMASEAILTSVVRRVKEHLPEDKREEFFRLFETPASDEEKAAFFKSHVPDFQKILLEEVARFKQEALAAAQKNQ